MRQALGSHQTLTRNCQGVANNLSQQIIGNWQAVARQSSMSCYGHHHMSGSHQVLTREQIGP